MFNKKTWISVFPIWQIEASRYDRNDARGHANIFHYREPHSENFIFLTIFGSPNGPGPIGPNGPGPGPRPGPMDRARTRAQMGQGPLGPMGQGLGPGLGPWTGPKLPRASPNPDPALRPRGGAARGQDPNPGWILPMSGFIIFDTFSQTPLNLCASPVLECN